MRQKTLTPDTFLLSDCDITISSEMYLGILTRLFENSFYYKIFFGILPMSEIQFELVILK